MIEWRDIKGYEGLYQVSNEGNVKSNNLYAHREPKIMKLQHHDAGYASVALSKNGKTKSYLVHRLVAEAFLDNPNNYDFVNHKDENKRNNDVHNLEWCTKSYNAIYYLSMDEHRKKEYAERFVDKTTGKRYSSWTTRIPHKYFENVIQIDRDGKVLKIFENPTEAAIASGALVGNIISVCKWNKTHTKMRTAKGYIWKFA